MLCVSQIIEITETTSTDAKLEIMLIESDKLQSIICAC